MHRVHADVDRAIVDADVQGVAALHARDRSQDTLPGIEGNRVTAFQRGQRAERIQRARQAGEVGGAVLDAAHADGLQAQACVLGTTLQ